MKASLQAILLATGEADVAILINGNSYPYNYATLETIPFLSLAWYNYWTISLNFVCPLPKRLASFYNILTPLSPMSWCLVFITLLTTSGAFVVINRVYKKAASASSSWNW